MAPKPKFTREEIVDVAVEIIRRRGLEGITAQAVADLLGTSTRPVFTYFDTLEALRAAAARRAKELYDGYAERGLAMTPAFKGFAMAYIRFASEEPGLFRLLFMRESGERDFAAFLDREGHLERVRETVMETFALTREQAVWLYDTLLVYAHGIAALCASGAARLPEEEIAEKLGTMCRACLMLLHAPKDGRTAVMPGEGVVMPGSVESYIGTDGNA